MARLLDVHSVEDALAILDPDDSDYSSKEEFLELEYGAALESAKLVYPRCTACFDFHASTDQRAYEMFRYRLDDIDRVCAALHVPDTMRDPNRTCWSGIEGLYILLTRLVYPSRLATLMRTFGRGRSESER